MIVDMCKVAEITEDFLTSTEDRTACEAKGTVPGNRFVMRVNTPLQLGGRKNTNTNYPRAFSSTPFDGCIRDLRHNGVVLILFTQPLLKQSFC